MNTEKTVKTSRLTHPIIDEIWHTSREECTKSEAHKQDNYLTIDPKLSFFTLVDISQQNESPWSLVVLYKYRDFKIIVV